MGISCNIRKQKKAGKHKNNPCRDPSVNKTLIPAGIVFMEPETRLRLRAVDESRIWRP